MTMNVKDSHIKNACARERKDKELQTLQATEAVKNKEKLPAFLSSGTCILYMPMSDTHGHHGGITF